VFLPLDLEAEEQPEQRKGDQADGSVWEVGAAADREQVGGWESGSGHPWREL